MNTHTADDAIRLAIVSNSFTPYRLNVHVRLVDEIENLILRSLSTHGDSQGRWADLPVPERIGPVQVGPVRSTMNRRDFKTLALDWKIGGEVIRQIQAWPADAVLCQGYYDLARLRLLRWCYRHGVTCFLTGDSNIKGDKPRGIAKHVKPRFVTWCVSCVDGVMPCGTMGQRFFQQYGASADRTHLYPLEPHYPTFENVRPDLERQIVDRFGLSPWRRRLVFSARMTDVKRPDLLLAAFTELAQDHPNWDLVMLGSGPLQESLSVSLPEELQSRVLWAGYIGDSREIAALYRHCDVLVLPSDYEPWAVVLPEAAAAGLAIVASDCVGAAAEVVRPGINGFLFERGNQQDLQHALNQVMQPEQIDRLKAGSAPVIADWKRRGDPVQGVCEALRSVGLQPKRKDFEHAAT